MEYARQIVRMLHDEHGTTIDMLERLEGVLARQKPDTAPDLTNGSNIAGALDMLVAAVESEIGSHFTFEEEELFPRLADFGDKDIAELLAEEHEVILPLGREVSALAAEARKSGFSAEDWRLFHRKGGELIERMIAHIQKEEMGMLPVLEDVLDEEEDSELMADYAMTR